MPAKLPEHLIGIETIPRLKDMPVGEHWYVNFNALVADKQTRECFLNPEEKRADYADSFGTIHKEDILVNRDDAGFHVIVRHTKYTLLFRFRLLEQANKLGYTIPVESIVEEETPR